MLDRATKQSFQTFVTEDVQFQQEVDETRLTDKLLLIELHSNWCGPCQPMKPMLQRLLFADSNREIPFHVVVADVDLIIESAASKNVMLSVNPFETDDTHESKWLKILKDYQGTIEPVFLFYRCATLCAIVEGVNLPKVIENINVYTKREFRAQHGPIQTDKMKHQHAFKLQCKWRRTQQLQRIGVFVNGVFYTHAEVQKMKLEEEEKQRQIELLKRQNLCAIKIQAVWRGRQTRKWFKTNYKTLRHRKSMWMAAASRRRTRMGGKAPTTDKYDLAVIKNRKANTPKARRGSKTDKTSETTSPRRSSASGLINPEDQKAAVGESPRSTATGASSNKPAGPPAVTVDDLPNKLDTQSTSSAAASPTAPATAQSQGTGSPAPSASGTEKEQTETESQAAAPADEKPAAQPQQSESKPAEEQPKQEQTTQDKPEGTSSAAEAPTEAAPTAAEPPTSVTEGEAKPEPASSAENAQPNPTAPPTEPEAATDKPQEEASRVESNPPESAPATTEPPQQEQSQPQGGGGGSQDPNAPEPPKEEPQESQAAAPTSGAPENQTTEGDEESFALHKAIKKGASKESIQALLDSPHVFINEQDEAGDTALHHACAANNPEVVELLLAKQAAVDTKNKQGQTPIFVAQDNSALAVVQLLMQKGVNF
eukprot:TRINITY_DN67242_c3_g2_i2.p1 TRINITY_DN67242_c3_g2~~TRINITY_DN67242_c3_g2_i2.p1  ORF type:complete len:654 (+),score=113.56 TRINITY_DN67242_c3_g2_i2:153-2114(+)